MTELVARSESGIDNDPVLVGDLALLEGPQAPIDQEGSRLAPTFAHPNHLITTDSITTTPPQSLPTSHRPADSHLRSSSVLFTSELLPRSFSPGKREKVLRIFREDATYVPRRVTMASSRAIAAFIAAQCYVPGPTPPAGDPYDPPLGPGGQGWPSDGLPLEIIRELCQHLSRSDIQHLRLVNREFEKNTSNILFRSVVLPFHDEIYGMMTKNSEVVNANAVDVKGKGKAKGKPPHRAVVKTLITVPSRSPRRRYRTHS